VEGKALDRFEIDSNAFKDRLPTDDYTQDLFELLPNSERNDTYGRAERAPGDAINLDAATEVAAGARTGTYASHTTLVAENKH